MARPRLLLLQPRRWRLKLCAVVDRTGVTGVLNVHREFARDETARPLPGNSAPSIFTALDKLGLKLVPERGPRGFIVNA